MFSWSKFLVEMSPHFCSLKKLLDSVEFGSSDFLQVDKQIFTDGFQIEQTPDDILV